MTPLEMAKRYAEFDPEKYWAAHDYKKWVVVVSRGSGKKQKQEIVYVGSRTKEGAERTARAVTYIKGRVAARARLATPRDLGAIPT